jgi:hypothetical protein
MSKDERRKWLDSLTPEDRAELRAEHERTREPWDRNRRQNRKADAYRKQRDYILEDMRRGASLEVTAKRYDLDYGLLVALLIDDGLLVLRVDKGSGSTAEVVRVKR